MLELIRNRRSIRSYTGEPIDPALVAQLVEVLLRAPSSRNINPWEFVVVDDRERLAALSLAKQHGSSFLKGAAVGIVVCADGTKSDVWVEDCSIASILVQMAAQSLGLGSCWIQIRKRQHDTSVSSEEYIRAQLGLPEHLMVESIIAIGHPAEKRTPLPAESLEFGKVRHNGYAGVWER